MNPSEAIQLLRNEYSDNRDAFEFNATTIVGGDSKKELRSEVYRLMTGEAIGKVSVGAIVHASKTYFNQLTIEF